MNTAVTGSITEGGSAPDQIKKITYLADYKASITAPQQASLGGSNYIESASPVLRNPVARHLKRAPIGEEFSKILDAENKKYLNDAFFRLADATDPELDCIERSNNFDEWKDLLEIVARKADLLTINHRKILGTLIVATQKKDIADFDIVNLKSFLEATNTLRQPRVNSQDSDRIISKLSNLEITLPLAIDEEEPGLSHLDDIMNTLDEKSRQKK